MVSTGGVVVRSTAGGLSGDGVDVEADVVVESVLKSALRSAVDSIKVDGRFSTLI